MDLAKEFEEYLPRWSEEKHLPIPTKQHMERWYQAWDDFVKEELAPRWESLRDEYKALKLKGSEPEEEIEEVSEEPEQETFKDIVPEEAETQDEPKEQLTEWDRVQKAMKDLQ